MSEETMKAIEKELSAVKYSDFSLTSRDKGIQATYVGYKVFINNNLNFGIVEIR